LSFDNCAVCVMMNLAIWKATIQNMITDLSKQIIFDHIRKEVKAIRTAGSNADRQLLVALLIELKAQIL